MQSPLQEQGQNAQKGLTLIELITVVMVLALLAAILYPMIRASVEKANTANCASNLRSIGSAAHLFAANNHGMLPGIRFTAASDSQPLNRHPGEQWDAQIMPYMGLDAVLMASDIKTVFCCPSAPLNPNAPLSRQLSYAWNARISETFDSKRLSQMDEPSTIVMAIDNKILGGEPDMNQVTFGGSSNTIYTNENLSRLRRVPYERHGGEVNVLFVDGSVSTRGPVSDSNPTPRRVRFRSGGPMSD